MGMKTSTALNHKVRFFRYIAEIWLCDRKSHEEMLVETAQRVYTDPAWAKVPQWVRQSVFAYREATVNCCHRFGRLVFLHVWQGQRYPKFDLLPEEAKDFVRKGGTLESHHFWASTGVRYS